MSPRSVAVSAESRTSTSAPLETCEASAFDGPELITTLTPLFVFSKPLAMRVTAEAADDGTDTVKGSLLDAGLEASGFSPPDLA